MIRHRSRPMVDLARAIRPSTAPTPETHHFGVVGSVQSTTATLSSLDGAAVTLAGVSWIVAPTAGSTVLLIGFSGRLLIIGPVS